jgi:hypothetical protein
MAKRGPQPLSRSLLEVAKNPIDAGHIDAGVAGSDLMSATPAPFV